MVALAKISVKSIHPQEGSNKQKEPFFILFTTWGHKTGHNSPVVGRTEFRWRPSCSLRDSASDKVYIGYRYLKKGGPCDGSRTRF